MRAFGTCLGLFCLAFWVACSGGGEDLCEGLSCSGHGHCDEVDGQALCVCEAGYHVSADGRDCLIDSTDPCAGITCSGLGRCRTDAEDQPYCECQGGTFPSSDGLDCLEPACTEDCGAMGCCGDHCCEMRPANAERFGGFEQTGLNLTASGGFDSDEDCASGSILGSCGPAAGVCVCRCDSLTVNGALRLSGSLPVAVLASNQIVVSGTLDLSASGAEGGAGARPQAQAATTWYGGKGGSCGTAGGSAGEAPACTADLQPLVGGQFGQDGCGGRTGGAAGGGVQLSAALSLSVTGTIQAIGAGGQGGQGDSGDGTCIGAAGGGSGGAILLESPTVTVSGAIWANGGGGGGGGNNHGSAGTAGADATNSMTPASGGLGQDGLGCALYEDIEGGDGGSGAAGSSSATDGEAYDHNLCQLDPQPYVGGGGGGGGFGRVRINTLSTCDCAAGTFSPAYGPGVIGKR